MYLKGSFTDIYGNTITVEILTGKDSEETIEIGSSDNADVFFAADPVEINSELNDSFDVLLPHSATISLLSKKYLPQLFSASVWDAVVNIRRGDELLFAGYIEPQAYEQDFNSLYDEISLSCIDLLSALQYSNYAHIGEAGILYDVVKAEADTRTWLSLLNEIIYEQAVGLDIHALLGGEATSPRILYDLSKSLPAGLPADLFFKVSIAELLFLDDDEDGVWTMEETLIALLKYFNLHILQQGMDFYIFDWQTIRQKSALQSNGTDGQKITHWIDLITNDTTQTQSATLTLTADIVEGTDGSITVPETFNQLLLTCSVESIEDLIESPLDDDMLTSPFSNKQKYMIEYSAEGNGVSAIDCFRALLLDDPTGYDAATTTHHFIQIYQHPSWRFPIDGSATDDWYSKYANGSANQHAMLQALKKKIGAAIIKFGSYEKTSDVSDNSLVSKVDMTTSLVVSINGDGTDTEDNADKWADKIKAACPIAEYTGNISGGTLTPTDSGTTNYIVISGKIKLLPRIKTSGRKGNWDNNPLGDSYQEMLQYKDELCEDGLYWHQTVSGENEYGRYYCQRYLQADTPKSEPNDTNTPGISPDIDKAEEMLQFNYSAIGDETDTISKIAVLQCMLVIGDKCAVETGTSGAVSDIVWKTYKTPEQCASDDEYYQQSFTIGFDPKIGDCLIGTDFDIQNNISYQLGLDAEGTAIPISKADKISGKVLFKILGPVNSVFDEITRRHPSFWRHTQWNTTSRLIMANVSAIFLSDFEITIHSDNGLVNNTGDADLVYMSNTTETFYNKKDDLEFEISSGLTTAECQQLDVTQSIKLSTPLMGDNEAVIKITDHTHTATATAKAEQLYVNQYYEEYHKPLLILKTGLQDRDSLARYGNLYYHPALSKTFYTQGISRSLRYAEATLQLKEI